MLDVNIPVVKKCNEELMNALLSDWAVILEKTAATVHLNDKSSIQEAIDEFIRTYGSIDKPFSETLLQSGSPFALIIHETKNKPNNKQFGAAQYCLGLIRRFEK
jgi:hypothetical protein